MVNLVATHPVQSWEWGEFRKKTGNKVVRIEGYQLTIHRIPYTNFKIAIFLQGPAPNREMLKVLKKLALEENLIFVRIEPNVVETQDAKRKTENLLRQNGAVKGKPTFNETTYIVDLKKSEEELLKNMHPKTRYNIRVAQRHGVKVVEDNSPKAFAKYLDLMKETVKRQGFYAHSEKYHRLMWETLRLASARSGQAPIAHLFTAKYKEEILIAWILFVWGNTLYYPYGASSDKYRNVMASYAMMWNAILFGKKMGLSKFDMWGGEEGKGFARFKEGFGGKRTELVGSWDLVTNPTIYPFYRLAEKLRWVILKLKSKILPISSFR